MAWYRWAHGRGPALSSSDEVRRGRGAPQQDRASGALQLALQRWTDAGLLSAEQARAIVAYETAAAGPPRRVSVLAEALGYLGAALAAAGAAAALGQVWEDWPEWSHLVVAAVATVGLLAGGWLLRNQTEPAFNRLASVLWGLAVGAAAWTLVVLTVEVADLPDRMDDSGVAVLVAACLTGLAAILWLARREAIQLTILFGSAIALVSCGIWALPGEAPSWAFALAVWLLSVLWAWLGWRELIRPAWPALAEGTLAALIAPSAALADHGWVVVAGLATAAFLMAVSIPTRQTPLLAVGTLGLFGYVTWAVIRYFGDMVGVPVALVLVGVTFLVLAVVAGRLGRLTQAEPAPRASVAE